MLLLYKMVTLMHEMGTLLCENGTKLPARPIEVKHNLMVLLMHENGNEIFDTMMLLLCKMRMLLCEWERWCIKNGTKRLHDWSNLLLLWHLQDIFMLILLHWKKWHDKWNVQKNIDIFVVHSNFKMQTLKWFFLNSNRLQILNEQNKFKKHSSPNIAPANNFLSVTKILWWRCAWKSLTNARNGMTHAGPKQEREPIRNQLRKCRAHDVGGDEETISKKNVAKITPW